MEPHATNNTHDLAGMLIQSIPDQAGIVPQCQYDFACMPLCFTDIGETEFFQDTFCLETITYVTWNSIEFFVGKYCTPPHGQDKSENRDGDRGGSWVYVATRIRRN